MKCRQQFAPLLMLPLLLACPGGGDRGFHGENFAVAEGENTIAFSADIPSSVIAGTYGVGWKIFTNPQLISCEEKLHLDGPGSLQTYDNLGNRVVLDLTRTDLPNGCDFVPSATVSAEGATAYISMEVLSPISHRWESSPKYPIRIVPMTGLMTFRIPINGVGTQDPTAFTLHPGETRTPIGLELYPRPLDLQLAVTLLSDQPAGTDLGAITTAPNTADGKFWSFDYTAPAKVESAFDVTIRAVAHDPWNNLDPVVEYTVHLVP